MDANLWNDLHAEAGKRGVAFYLVDIAGTLPILFDPKDEVGQTLRLEMLPQYILFTRIGEVIHRWDGVRRYEKKNRLAELARFFQPH